MGTTRLMKLSILSHWLVLLLFALPLFATDYYVDEIDGMASDSNDGSIGSPWLTLANCFSDISAGDTCNIANTGQTLAGGTMLNDGSSGNYITLLCESGGTQGIFTSNLTFSGRSYIRVEGCAFGATGTNGPEIVCNNTNRCDHLQVVNNVFNETSGTGFVADVFGDHILLDGNTFLGLTDDPIRGYGNYWVVRNNVADGLNAGSNHLDFFQGECPIADPIDFVLLEGNKFTDITGSQVHFFLMNASGCGDLSTNFIVRYNTIRDIGETYVLLDAGGGSKFSDVYNYNNTVGRIAGEPSLPSRQDNVAGGSGHYNNIYYDSMTLSGARGVTNGVPSDCNLAFDPDGSMTFSAPLSTEPNSLRNVDPGFNDYANDDFTLMNTSMAIDAGCALTTVAVADTGSGTTLILDETSMFQDGWADVTPDSIAVGAVTNTVQISSIDYAANTITLANSISRMDGDKVWLYSKSDGAIVLFGAAPDIGAMELDVQNPDTGSPTPRVIFR